MRVTPLELGIAFGAGHKEGPGFVNGIEPGEIQVASIYQVESAGLQQQIVQHIDLLRLAVGDVDEAGDIAAQIQQRVLLDGRLGGAKRCPGKHRQAQHELCKNELALVHGGFGRNAAKKPKSGVRRSNRDQTETLYLASKSLTYEVLT
jgi:hypothetical protein